MYVFCWSKQLPTLPKSLSELQKAVPIQDLECQKTLENVKCVENNKTVPLQLFHQAAAEFKHKMNKANEKERAMYKAMFNPESKSTPDKKSKASSGVRYLCHKIILSA